MIRLAYLVLTAFVGAALVHILEIFTIPALATNDAWARISRQSSPGIFRLVTPDMHLGDRMAIASKGFVLGVCHFSLDDGPVLVRGPQAPSFWSMSVYNRRGENIFSVNDRITPNGELDILVATPVQIIELQNDMPAELSETVFAEADTGEGFVILRTFLEVDSQRSQADAFVAGSTCETY